MYFLSKELYFPAVEEASIEGILAVGGDLSPKRLILAYKNGIFPWYDNDEPKLWWCPEERMVLFFENLRITKSMRNILNRKEFHRKSMCHLGLFLAISGNWKSHL